MFRKPAKLREARDARQSFTRWPMCTRFALTCAPEDLRAVFALEPRPDFAPRYNIAPTQPVVIIRVAQTASRVSNRAALVRWGFLPSFVKDPNTFPSLFNAKAEGIDSKRSFKNALRRRRCLIPATAFYVWRKFGSGTGARSQPFLARRSDGIPMGLAGLYETWVGPNGEEVDTACIVTTSANGVSAAIHSRLPVVIEPGDVRRWLAPDEATAEHAATLLRSPEDHVLSFIPVSEAINTVGREGPDVQIAIGATLSGPIPAPVEPRQASLF